TLASLARAGGRWRPRRKSWLTSLVIFAVCMTDNQSRDARAAAREAIIADGELPTRTAAGAIGQGRAEAALRWDVSQDLLVVADLEGKYLSVNPAWTATLGWSEADLLGKTSRWLLHPDDVEKTRAEISRLAAGQKTVRFESRLRDKARLIPL